MNLVKNNKGFTIIEVVLVLAIAGLIFLMVFVALPALQNGQRDSQRREDVSRAVSQLTSYQTNNKGSLPADSAFSSFMTNYLRSGGSEFEDPSTGSNYTAPSVDTAGDATLSTGQMQYKRNARCSGENIVLNGSDATNNRQAAVRVKLQGAGHFCQNVN
jgi:prepilin-type N-terminal cleavage/methylation domain-containing protein